MPLREGLLAELTTSECDALVWLGKRGSYTLGDVSDPETWRHMVDCWDLNFRKLVHTEDFETYSLNATGVIAASEILKRRSKAGLR